ncbi:hypothetical protein COLO4_05785 [Corchorus olitorius]|uniref:Uncharacterized protein n=1 Tax=Corchorus olitorius TaxID=93759 RepID=A0A1R3KPZ4_9ROSI|nr:hypothetical protein COLO4_05785 [Corchorus olitorius]
MEDFREWRRGFVRRRRRVLTFHVKGLRGERAKGR